MDQASESDALVPVFFNDTLCYLHIPKCGGLSVSAAAREGLPNYTEPGQKRNQRQPGSPIGHIRAADFQQFVGRPLNSFQEVFATIRSPVSCEWSKYNFWRRRFYKDGDNVAWRHPADQFCWDRSWGEYIASGVEPFNDWYCKDIAPWARTNYNTVGRFEWWLSDEVQTINIENTKAINAILRRHGCKKKVPHLHRTGAGSAQVTDEQKKLIEAYYVGSLA
jgi:hypothetical protein